MTDGLYDDTIVVEGETDTQVWGLNYAVME